ncbi:MAG: hypothetical protein ACTHMC_23880 [Pseudobacter sp.]|uniref:hypothetical protein n=1 Tax=Pseudobacter sp. TaxID=2045420 RepID=UPI003F810C32
MRILSYYRLILLIPVAILFTMSCGKDKLRSKPSIKLKSISTRELDSQGNPYLVVEFDYADKEGDIGNPYGLWLEKTRLNQRLTALTGNDTFSLGVPEPVVPRTDGQIEARIQAQDLFQAQDPGNPAEPDSMNLRFVLRDAAGNTSDTLDAGMISVIRYR